MNRHWLTLFVVFPLLLSAALLPAQDVGTDPQKGENGAKRSDRAAIKGPQAIDFTTGYLATPISLPNDPTKITALGIKCNLKEQAQGNGTFIIDKSPANFDSFGDARVQQKLPRRTFPVTLRRVGDPRADRQLFRLEFDAGLWLNRIYYVHSFVEYTESRLLIRAETGIPPAIRVTGVPVFVSRPIKLSQMLPEATRPPRANADKEAVRDTISLTSYHFHMGGDGYMRIYGNLKDSGALIFDSNHVTYGPFGDVGTSTMMAFASQPFKFRRMDIDDPKKMGRRVYQLQLRQGQARRKPNARQLFLVVAPHLGGPHRLLVKQGDKITDVQPLHDATWRQFLIKKHKLAQASVGEQQAIAAIRERISTRFDFDLKDDKLTSISFYEKHCSDQLVKNLRELPHLKTLAFMNCRTLTDAGLAVLTNLKNLEQLTFYATPVQDASLIHVGQLAKLKHLRIYDETPRGVSPQDVPHVTDKGLAQLKDLGRLESLSLYGPGISDAGLPHLTGLTKLRNLDFQQTKVTPAGLAKLSESLRNTKLHSNTRLIITIHRKKRTLVIEGNATDKALQQLSTLTDIQFVRMSGIDNISDDGIQHLSKLKGLEKLSLQHGRALTDNALRHLRRCQQLQELNLWYCSKITDKGLRHLHSLSKLRQLNVGGTKVTDKAIAELRQALPECKVQR